jgi:hypothetical protein
MEEYMDGLLLAGSTWEDYMEGTCLHFSLLWETGYKVSQKKDQICQDTIKYFSFHLLQGQHRFGPERKHAVYSILAPKTHQKKSEFLGPADFCQIWIPNYSLLAKPLYNARKGGEQEPLVWEEHEKTFKEIKRALTNAPALGLPDMIKLFFLYVHE